MTTFSTNNNNKWQDTHMNMELYPEDDEHEESQEIFFLIEMLDSDERFGFSVMGGVEEGFLPRVDEIIQGSPADRSDLEIGDEILEVNGKTLQDASHAEVINHIHQCVQSRTISLRVRRSMGLSTGELNPEAKRVQEAYIIAVEQQAKNKLAQIASHNNVHAIDLATLTNTSGDAINGDWETSLTTPDEFSSVPASPTELDLPVNTPLVDKAQLALAAHQAVNSNTLNGFHNNGYSSSTDSLPDIGLQNNGVNTVVTNADIERFAAPEDTESVKSHEYPDHQEVNSKRRPVKASNSSNSSERSENETEMVLQSEVPTLSSSRQKRVPREVAVDCPASFVAASGMKNPPLQQQQQSYHKPARQMNGGSSVSSGSDIITPNCNSSSDKVGKQKTESQKQEEYRKNDQQNASQNNSRGSVLALESVGTQPLFEEETLKETEGNNRKVIELRKLLANLEHMRSRLRSDPQNTEKLAFLSDLFHNAEFQQALEVHNQVTGVHQRRDVPLPVAGDVQTLAAEVKAEAKLSQTSEEEQELGRILETPQLKSLLMAHDQIASRDPTVMLGLEDQDEDQDTDVTNGEEAVKIVRIDKSTEPLGATILNDGETIVIGRIIKGGMAERSGLLHEGDEILKINDQNVQGKSVNEICDFMSTLSGTLTFLMVPTKQHRIKPPPKDSSLMHMRAHFDYDPEDDMYIPCRELGLSFHKGDVLHIIAQEDTNWWQAYREGEEDQTLAGLIPSRTFQQQREAMKQTMPEDDEPKKRFFCGGKSKKKKKKKKLYNANSSNQPSDEILTYEEVCLYSPSNDRKRPVVLIGPPKVGRHELRQRLLESDGRFAAAIPHTSRPKKDHEVHGVDYYFTTRQRFEQDILSEKFVEHGEYERNVYGTSLEAIRSSVDASKICVLNLHPQPEEFKHGMRKTRAFMRSLRVLKNSDLKPYFIFICPPSLDRLRQQRTEAGELLKEEELREIIETSRAMEDTYGHYFDYVIIHYDHDRAFAELLQEIDRIQTEPQWVPATWLTDS